jgi:hypothetical protein
MNHKLTAASLAELTAAHPPPCLSLYQPTSRHRPDNQQDPIRFGNLVKTLAASLQQLLPSTVTRALLAPFESLAREHEFWNHTLDGLAVFSSTKFFRVFRLQRAVPELAVVADTFHTKPLRRILQTIDRYQVLSLSRGAFRLFEGNRDALDELDPSDGIPRTIAGMLGEELTTPRLTVASYGGSGKAGAMHHGHGGRKDEVDLDAERFFRAVDRAVLEGHSQPSGLPLVLAALPEHHHLFRTISRNPYLLETGLLMNPDALSLEELRQRVWEVLEPQYHARQEAIVDAFSQARSRGLGSDDLAQVAKAAADGRVATLLIESERHIAGLLDETTGQVDKANLDHPEVDDVLDDLGALVETMGGEIHVIPAQRMPGSTGLAAIYRH